jgi:hypothetical protein
VVPPSPLGSKNYFSVVQRPLFFLLLFQLWMFQACDRCRDGCVNGYCQSKVCHCDTWYEGDRCDRSTLTKHLGAYRGVRSEEGFSTEVEFSLVPVSEVPNVLILDELGLELEFVDQARFLVHEWEEEGVMYTGEGEMLIESISLRLDRVEEPGSSSIRILAQRVQL